MLQGGKILILLNIADLLLTGVGLKMDFFEENNFIQHWYYSSFGIIGIVALKIIVITPLILAVESAWRNSRIMKERAKNYYAAANLTFILPFCFFTIISNFSGYNAP
jgi:hypothetical protein